MVISKTVTVKQRRTANLLIKAGFNILEVIPSSRNPASSCFVFKNSDEIEQALNKIQKDAEELRKQRKTTDKQFSYHGGYGNNTKGYIGEDEDK